MSTRLARYFKLAPGVNCMLGPMDVQSKVKEPPLLNSFSHIRGPSLFMSLMPFVGLQSVKVLQGAIQQHSPIHLPPLQVRKVAQRQSRRPTGEVVRPEEGQQLPCNVWVFCGDAGLCGQQYRECWLKRLAYPIRGITAQKMV